MAAYSESRHTINGVDTAVFTAGEGETLVFLHGAGTVTGFDALLPLAERFRLVVPHHPGYGASGDDPNMTTVHDYVHHYLDLFDELGIDELSIAGHSMGGYVGAMFAIEQTRRVRRLVLAAPFGLRDREHPTVDIFSIPDERLLPELTMDMSVFDGHVPMPPTPEFLADRYRESTSTARMMWGAPYDLKLARWLHRLTMPTLLLWGDADKLIPVEQAPSWAELIPNATVRTLPGVGHLLFDESREAVDAVGDFVGAAVAA
jgi:pimeloyl-ACP methyl ester carboxylesterase